MNADRKKAGITVLLADKTDWKAESHTRNKGQYLTARETTLQDGTVIPHLCAPGDTSLKLPETKWSGWRGKTDRPPSGWGPAIPLCDTGKNR